MTASRGIQGKPLTKVHQPGPGAGAAPLGFCGVHSKVRLWIPYFIFFIEVAE
jgi:hypothetical protein